MPNAGDPLVAYRSAKQREHHTIAGLVPVTAPICPVIGRSAGTGLEPATASAADRYWAEAVGGVLAQQVRKSSRPVGGGVGLAAHGGIVSAHGHAFLDQIADLSRPHCRDRLGWE